MYLDQSIGMRVKYICLC